MMDGVVNVPKGRDGTTRRNILLCTTTMTSEKEKERDSERQLWSKQKRDREGEREREREREEKEKKPTHLYRISLRFYPVIPPPTSISSTHLRPR